MMARRRVLKTALAALGAVGASRGRPSAAVPELRLPDDVPSHTVDFDAPTLAGWTTVAGLWTAEEMAGAPSGKAVLVQRATSNEFNVIVAPGAYADVDVRMAFRPIAGRQDASGGIVFR